MGAQGPVILFAGQVRSGRQESQAVCKPNRSWAGWCMQVLDFVAERLGYQQAGIWPKKKALRLCGLSKFGGNSDRASVSQQGKATQKSNPKATQKSNPKKQPKKATQKATQKVPVHPKTARRFQKMLCEVPLSVEPAWFEACGSPLVPDAKYRRGELRLFFLWLLLFFGSFFLEHKQILVFPPPKKMVKVGGLGGGLLMVPCSGFYVHLKSVFPLIRF